MKLKNILSLFCGCASVAVLAGCADEQKSYSELKERANKLVKEAGYSASIDTLKPIMDNIQTFNTRMCYYRVLSKLDSAYIANENITPTKEQTENFKLLLSLTSSLKRTLEKSEQENKGGKIELVGYSFTTLGEGVDSTGVEPTTVDSTYFFDADLEKLQAVYTPHEL